jgi:hypothetical protein
MVDMLDIGYRLHRTPQFLHALGGVSLTSSDLNF